MAFSRFRRSTPRVFALVRGGVSLGARQVHGLVLLGVLAGAAAAGSVAGCSVAGSSDAEGSQLVNACDSDSDCSGGVCSGGMCRVESPGQSGLGAVLLEVTPPAGASAVAGVRFTSLVLPDELDTSLDVELPYISHVRGSVTAKTVPEDECLPADPGLLAPPAADGSLPARISVIPRQRLLGMSTAPLTREIAADASGNYDLSFNVPPGLYDIYAEPLGATDGCFRPPYLVLSRPIEPGDIDFSLELPVPEKLDITVRFPGLIDALNGWKLDVVDRDTGRLLSNRAVLSSPEIESSSGGLSYRAVLAFSPVVSDAADAMPATELVRLSPPEGVAAPTLYVERSVVELFQDGAGVIDQLTALPSPVTYTGRITEVGTTTGAKANVTLIATQLQHVSSGTIAAFVRTVESDEAGVFQVDLLPGTYAVRIEPASDTLAQSTASITVSASGSMQAGKALEVKQRAHFGGRMISFSGDLLGYTTVQASPSPVLTTANVLSLARGEYPVYPRTESESSESDGRFDLLLDAGEFRLVARPEVTSGLPWYVQLGVTVEGGDVWMDDLAVSVPVVAEGAIRSADVGAVPGSLVRAYALLAGSEPTADPDEATAVVGIGEARVDSKSAFRLLLPSTIVRPPTQE